MGGTLPTTCVAGRLPPPPPRWRSCCHAVSSLPTFCLLLQCPVEIIERNIKKASESKADYAEMTYEAYGHGGTGFVIECL